MPRPTPTRVRNHLCAGLDSRIARLPAGNQPSTPRVCPGPYSSGGDRSGRDGLARQFSGRDCLGCHYSGRRSWRCDRRGGNDFGKAGGGRGHRQHADSLLSELGIQSAGLAAGDRSSQRGSTSRCILPRCPRGSHQQLSSLPFVLAPRREARGLAGRGRRVARLAGAGIGVRAEVPGTAVACGTCSRVSARKNARCLCAGHALPSESLPSERMLSEMMFGRARCLGEHCRRDIWCRIG